MTYNYEQGNDHKVAGTQETITAQNSTNQGKKNFDGSKKLFNAVDVYDLATELSYYDFGIVNPSYIISNLEMAQRLIDKARMSPEQKAVLNNAYGFLCLALVKGKAEADEIIACSNWPDDIRQGIEDGDMDTDEARDSITEELGYIFTDIDNMIDGELKGWREVAEQGLELAQEYLDVAEDYEIELEEWYYEKKADLDNQITI